MRSLPLFALIAAVGCAPSKPPFTWLSTRADVRALSEQYPNALAVIQRREERFVFTFDGSGPATQVQRHDVIAILAEGGDRWAEVAVPVGNSRLQYLRARTIAPDGDITEVTPEEVHTSVAHVGNWLSGVDAQVKVFRLPNVHVGSVIEYAYGIEDDRLLLSARRPISAPIPTAHYHAEFAAKGPVDLGLRVYNHRGQAKGSRESTTYDGQIVRLDQSDVPAMKIEPFAPPASVTEPYWAVAVVAMARQRRGGIGVYDTWSHALSGLSLLLYQDEAGLFSAAALKPKLDGCAPGPRCVVERTLMLINRTTELSGFYSNLVQTRSLKEIRASGLANNVEKAMMLQRALNAAKVSASFVVLARDLNTDFDPEFPSSDVFDHLIVRVDKQPGLDAPLFVDPSCEACDVGELPSWTAGRQAMVIGKNDNSRIQAEARIEHVRLGGGEPAPSVHRQAIDATIDAAGALNGRITDELSGAAAVDVRVRTRSWLDDRWRQELESDLHARARTAGLRKTQPAAFEKVDARLTFGVEFATPGYATRVGARQIVPLSFLHMEWDRDFGDEPRHHDVLLRDATREEETIVFHLPSGWSATELPRSESWHSDALDAAVNVKSDGASVTVRRIVQTHVGHWGPAEFDDIAAVAKKLAAIRQAAFVIVPSSAAR